MNLDNLREETIDSLYVFLEDPGLTLEEKHVINDCASMLINGRSPEKVAEMEIALLGAKSNG